MSGKVLTDDYLWKRAFDRFQNRFTIDQKSKCWNWTAGQSTRPDGSNRGVFTMPRCAGSRPASQCSWIFHKGHIPKGRHVLHTCDNSLCVNPEHLYLVDHAQNMKDKKNRHRQWNDRDPAGVRGHLETIRVRTDGERNGARKLGWIDVDKIRQSRAISARKLAAEFEVDRSLIYLIWSRKLWDEGLRHD